jgi:hypothetical protein
MMTFRATVPTVLGLLVIAGALAAAEPLKSGPQVGDTLPGPFHPLNVNGSNAGEKSCLYCRYGDSPVVAVFAREASEPLTALIKKLDAATAKNGGAGMGSFVVFLSDEEALEKQLKELAKKQDLKETVLSIDDRAGPPEYKIAKDADVTVLLYVERTVKANHTFKKGQMKDRDVERVVADLEKILPKK